MLFATQNPPGAYAGRKALSRAFRGRFLELHVDEPPDGELTGGTSWNQAWGWVGWLLVLVWLGFAEA
jgi:hypothetical protein